MKHLMKVSLMALVAMFAFNTTADAQLGGLLKKAKQAVGGQSKEKAYDPREARAAKEAAEIAARTGQVELKNWKTGEIGKVENTFVWRGEPAQIKTSEMIYYNEKNFSDKASKKKIIELFLDDEKFNNRKRAADDILKDRKIVAVLFKADSWTINRDNIDNITSRMIEMQVVSELTNGFTICDEWVVGNDYAGGGNYADAMRFTLKITTKGAYGKNGEYRWYLKDWEHKADADPLKDL